MTVETIMNPFRDRKRASIHTLGCRLNQGESSLIAERLSSAGYDLVPFGEPADLGIINTCTVTAEADAKSRKAIRAFIRKNPRAFVAVIGCYAQAVRSALTDVEGIDLILGSEHKLDVLDYVSSGKNDSPLVICGDISRSDFRIPAPGGGNLARRANLKIQDGCDFMCSYCIVPSARGRPRSRAFDNLLDEAQSLVRRGAKEIVLTGVNLGLYAHENHTLLEAIDRVSAIPGLARLRISSIELNTIPEGVLERMQDPAHALVPFLHVPLQSGSDRVLRAMNRKYGAEAYAAFLHGAAAAVPELCAGADVLVGFPGETEEDFEATCRLLENMPLAYVHVFKYSERPGSAAAELTDRVDARAMSRRSARVRAIGRDMRQTFHSRFLGRTVDVLFEQQGEDGRWTGYTGNYIRVAVRSSRCLKNCLMPVRLLEDANDVVVGQLEV